MLLNIFSLSDETRSPCFAFSILTVVSVLCSVAPHVIILDFNMPFMAVTPAYTIAQNINHVSHVVGALNAVGFLLSAVLSTHKITDLVGVGSFVVAVVSTLTHYPTTYCQIFSSLLFVHPHRPLGKFILS